jgi:NAD(P)-dependent dehydrogenase (short-subunit alcohol dehydrogenase family)
VNEIAEEFGSIDACIMCFDKFGKERVDKIKSEDFDDLVTANIWPVFHLFSALRDQVAKQAKEGKEWAKLVNVFSFVGKAGMSMAGVYSALKGSMIGLNKGLAREFGRFANVNAVAYGPLAGKGMPGPEDRAKKQWMVTSTDIGQNKDITPEKVAPLAVFLASSDADCIAGQTFSVDGGIWLKLEQ